MQTSNSARYLYQEVRRIERLNKEIKDLQEDVKDLYKGIKSSGFDPSIVRKVVKLREADPQEVRKTQDLVDTYSNHLERGMVETEKRILRKKPAETTHLEDEE